VATGTSAPVSGIIGMLMGWWQVEALLRLSVSQGAPAPASAIL
jgi:hypothetical protein